MHTQVHIRLVAAQPSTLGQTMSRTLSEPEKKSVAARQGWHCSACACVLPSAYQVDHTTPLCDGGRDHVDNATAMCPNCHAQKTQREAAGRARAARAATTADASAAYADRVDWDRPGNKVQCSVCWRERPVGAPHPVCVGLEDPRGLREGILLARFAYQPRPQVSANLFFPTG
jgi:hypothetical protein